MHNSGLRFVTIFLLCALAGCSNDESLEYADSAAPAQLPECDPDDGGIELPDGFCAVVVADSLGRARHIAVDESGDVYVAIRQTQDVPGGVIALRDTTGDGRADVTEKFAPVGGTGIALRDGHLYFAPDTAIIRFPLPADALAPTGSYEMVASGLPEDGSHAAKPFTFDDQGNIYVTIGAPSNACQEQDRTAGSPAQDPCPLLEDFGGIWRFPAGSTGMSFEADGERYATGIRNAVALDWSSSASNLYALQHGRDMLSTLFPEQYTEEESAELPAEEFFLINQGDDFGWPYCYYDQVQNEKVLAPEYGGDGTEMGRCEQAEDPILAFPGHWAPNDLLFYDGAQFPQQYQNGAFIAFHGSWNRAPLPQQGYNVVFVPFGGESPSGEYQTFADGFKGAETLETPSDATFRPMGLAVGPDGSLYISDSQNGRIWRVMYKG
jgi:glucose/arabinose dehydrogenase